MSRELTASRTFASGLAEPGPTFRPHRLTICRPLAQKKARGGRARIVWLRRVKSVMPAWSACRRVKSALRPHGLPPHEKRYASVVSSRRIKSALRTRAPPWPVVACSECATGARYFLPIALPAARRAPIFFYASRENSAKTFYKRPSV